MTTTTCFNNIKVKDAISLIITSLSSELDNRRLSATLMLMGDVYKFIPFDPTEKIVSGVATLSVFVDEPTGGMRASVQLHDVVHKELDVSAVVLKDEKGQFHMVNRQDHKESDYPILQLHYSRDEGCMVLKWHHGGLKDQIDLIEPRGMPLVMYQPPRLIPVSLPNTI